MVKVVIVEDDKQIAKSLQGFLVLQKDISVSGVFHSIMEIQSAFSVFKEAPDVILLDIILPEISGIEGIHLLKEKWPSVSIIIFSVMDDGFNIFRSLCAGAVGYINKDFTMEALLTAILDVSEGKGIMSPSIARKVAEYFHPKHKFEESLTNREMDIVNGITDGLSYKLIAAKLGVSIDTVRKHIKSVYKKLQINSKAQLMQQFLKK